MVVWTSFKYEESKTFLKNQWYNFVNITSDSTPSFSNEFSCILFGMVHCISLSEEKWN